MLPTRSGELPERDLTIHDWNLRRNTSPNWAFIYNIVVGYVSDIELNKYLEGKREIEKTLLSIQTLLLVPVDEDLISIRHFSFIYK